MKRPFFFFLLPLFLGTSGLANDFVTSVNGEFRLHGQRFRFIGYNIRGIAHFGEKDVLPHSQKKQREDAMFFAQRTNARVIRIFVASRHATKEQTGDRLEAVLDLAGQYGVYVMICLTDYYWATQMFPKGDEAYYYEDPWGWGVISPTWFSGGFRENYLPQAVYLANRFKNRPEIFAWTLGNEIKNPPNKEHFISAVNEITAAIRAVNPNHMIGIGSAGRSFMGLTWDQAIRAHQGISFVQQHNYFGSDTPNDISLAASLGLPHLIGEAGFDGTNRPAKTNSDISKWINRGSSGYLQWGVMPYSYDNGDGDVSVGVDPVFHAHDWQDYIDIFSDWGNLLSPPPPTPTPTPDPRSAMYFLLH